MFVLKLSGIQILFSYNFLLMCNKDIKEIRVCRGRISSLDLLHTKSEQKVMFNCFLAPITFKNPLNPVFQ